MLFGRVENYFVLRFFSHGIAETRIGMGVGYKRKTSG